MPWTETRIMDARLEFISEALKGHYSMTDLCKALALAFLWLYPTMVSAGVPHAPISEAEQTKVLVLGVEHLSSLGDSFDPQLMERTLMILESFVPDAIAVERVPPARIAHLVCDRDAAAEAALIAAFCADAVLLGREAQCALGISWREARARVDSLLALPWVRAGLMMSLAVPLPPVIASWGAGSLSQQ